MAAVSASTSLLLTDPMLRPPESTWAIVALGATLIVEVTGIVNATVMTITGTENVTAIAPRAATTGTVVIGTRIGTGVTEGAPMAVLLIAREEVILAALVGCPQGVLVNMINPKYWWYSPIDSPSRDASHSRFQVIKLQVSSPLYRTVSRLQTQAVPSISLKTCLICQELWNETVFFKRVHQTRCKITARSYQGEQRLVRDTLSVRFPHVECCIYLDAQYINDESLVNSHGFTVCRLAQLDSHPVVPLHFTPCLPTAFLSTFRSPLSPHSP